LKASFLVALLDRLNPRFPLDLDTPDILSTLACIAVVAIIPHPLFFVMLKTEKPALQLSKTGFPCKER
jgi:hypothetical protein